MKFSYMQQKKSFIESWQRNSFLKQQKLTPFTKWNFKSKLHSFYLKKFIAMHIKTTRSKETSHNLTTCVHRTNDFLWTSNGIQNLNQHHVVTNIESHNLDITNFGEFLFLKQLKPILLGEEEGFNLVPLFWT